MTRTLRMSFIAATVLVACGMTPDLTPTSPSFGRASAKPCRRTCPPPPDTTPPPPAGIVIQPGQSIQAAVNANPAGTTFVIATGTHLNQKVDPKDDDRFLCQPGAILDGGGVTPYAIGGTSLISRRVTVKGCVIQHYAPTADWMGMLGNDGAQSWVIDSNEVRNSTQSGVRITVGTLLRWNTIHHNPVMGISAYRAHKALIEGNEVYANAFTADSSAATATRAGMKIVGSDSIIVRRNRVTGNTKGVGIWFDLYNRWPLAEDNTVLDNGGPGIWFEVTYGGLARNNGVERNGGTSSGWLENAGIQISNSPNVEVAGNTVRDNRNGITAMQSTGYSADGGYGPLVVQNLTVHDNTVRHLANTKTGLGVNTGDLTVYTGRNNRWTNNSYTSGLFLWNNANLTWAQWQGAGQDVTGSFQP